MLSPQGRNTEFNGKPTRTAADPLALGCASHLPNCIPGAGLTGLLVISADMPVYWDSPAVASDLSFLPPRELIPATKLSRLEVDRPAFQPGFHLPSCSASLELITGWWA